MQLSKIGFACGVLLLGSGCASGSGAPAAQTPGQETNSPEAEEGGASGEKTAKNPPADVLYAQHPAVPGAPSTCLSGGPLPRQSACPEARADLAVALTFEGKARDDALLSLESCSEFALGLMRALRAELGMAECADVLVEEVVGDGTKSAELPSDIRETLVALGLGARLRRLAAVPPEAPTDHSKEALNTYFKDLLFPWVSAQAQAIFVMASQGTELSGYARGVVAVEAGNADMRFVEIVRAAPLSDEIGEHQEAKDLYYATLDEQLEPRKARGRNAALVGLREMARVGVRSSERVSSARTLLSSVYGGRRVNALDTLLVPPLAPQKAETDAAAIVSRVPSSYAAAFIGNEKPSPNLTRAHLQMGMTIGMRRQIESSGDVVSRLLLARALFESGRTYFRSEDFQAALALLGAIVENEKDAVVLSQEQRDEAIFLRALSLALVAGPKDAAEMIAQGPRFADALGNLMELDSLAASPGEWGGRASFNATYLRELIAPAGNSDYWRDLSVRYLNASKQLKGAEKKVAADRSKACRDIERAIIADERASQKK